jgi:SAM-dependent methyltransferase
MHDFSLERLLAYQHLDKGDPTGWFEPLYQKADEGKITIHWADLKPNPNLIDFWNRTDIPAKGKRALVVGCGFGDDAEQLAAWGFDTTAFDIAPTAIRKCRERFPDTRVNYQVTDLLSTARPRDQFDFVLESYTLQVLVHSLRSEAIRNIAGFVKEDGWLLVITRGRGAHETEGLMPWPLTRDELDQFKECGLVESSFADYVDTTEQPGVHRFRVLYHRPPVG